MSIRNLVLATALVLSHAQPVFPHSGGTNADGCHTNRQTGEYHCHGSKNPVSGSISYCHMVNGERRCGYSRSTCDDLASKYGGYCRQE
jgi:hypothetical protein